MPDTVAAEPEVVDSPSLPVVVTRVETRIEIRRRPPAIDVEAVAVEPEILAPLRIPAGQTFDAFASHMLAALTSGWGIGPDAVRDVTPPSSEQSIRLSIAPRRPWHG